MSSDLLLCVHLPRRDAFARFAWKAGGLVCVENSADLDFVRLTRNAEETRKILDRRRLKYDWRLVAPSAPPTPAAVEERAVNSFVENCIRPRFRRLEVDRRGGERT